MDGHWLRVFAATGIATIIATSDPLQTHVRQTPPLILESVAGRDSFEFCCASYPGSNSAPKTSWRAGMARLPR